MCLLLFQTDPNKIPRSEWIWFAVGAGVVIALFVRWVWKHIKEDY